MSKHSILALLFLSTVTTFGQSILFQDHTMHPATNIGSEQLLSVDASEVFNGRYYRLLQFDHIPNAEERHVLATNGVELLEYIPHNAYIASLRTNARAEQLREHGVKWVGKLDVDVKMHKWFFQQPFPEHVYAKDGIKVMLRFHRDVDYNMARSYLIRSGVVPMTEFPHADLLETVIAEELLFDLAALPFVAYIDMASEPGEPESLEGQIQHRSNGINTATYGGLKYDGTGVSIAINDDGAVGPHIDIKGRADQSDFTPGTFGGTHGDMTTGIAGGAGNIDPTIQGMAPGAFLWIRQYVSSLPNTVSLHTNEGVMAFSSSYSNGCNAGYTSTTQLVDQEINTYPTMIQSFSAGNSNNSDCGYGAGNQWGNVTGGHKIAKNVITAANLLQSETLVGSSSHGPASDGRIKPDISSHGNSQLSLDPNNSYGPGGGTSAACPGITGIFAQLVHAHRDLNGGADAESGLLKACMLNTTHDLGNVGPDYKFGWGRVNAWRAYEVLAENRYFDATVDQGGSNSHSITIPAGTEEARIMVYWMDPAASTSAAKALVNDLDMTLESGPTTYLPWVLDPTPDPVTLDLPATNGVDTLNNMEQVALTAPMAGTYTLTVSGTEVPMGPQKYYVVYEFFQGVRLTYPIGGEGLDPNTTEMLAWDAVGTVTTFDLDYSIDGGANWTSITTGIAGNLRQYNWSVPNTPSGDVLVRITRGADSDVSDEELSVMDVPANLSIDAVCPSYMRVTWDPVPNATHYAVHLLGAMYMDSVDQTALTTFDIVITNPNDEQWFSVTAYGANGMRSRRANAVQFTGGGVLNCPVDHDASIASILAPGGTYISCGTLLSDVVVDLANPGLNDESNIPVNYRFNGGAVVVESYVPVLPANSITTYTFATGITLNAGGPNLLEVWTSLPGDLATYNDTAIINVNVIGGTGTTIPLNEDLEAEALCGTGSDCGATTCALTGPWTNLSNGSDDDVDWRVNQGPTGSTGTGPSVDATTGTATGNYIYLETSGTCNGQEAQLISPCVDLAGTTAPQLTYSYHLYGADMGSLHVDLFDGSSWINDVTPAISGDQGDVWVPATVDLTPYIGSTVVIRFRGITGSGFTSDMALDDILIAELPACPAVSSVTSSGMTGGNATINWACLGCTGTYFVEYGLAGFTPGTDATAGGGSVVSSATTSVSLSGLPTCQPLDVYVRQDCGIDGFSFNSLVHSFSTSGTLFAPFLQDFDSFTAEDGTVSCGGVDNVGACWSNGTADGNDWTARSVATGSTGTGPSSDHTGAGNYLFTETSSPCFGSVAELFSPAIDVTALGVPELRFWYHMYGATMGTLEVHASDDGGATFAAAPIWTLSGNQSNQWFHAFASLAAYTGETDLVLRWTGTAGTSFTSDMAIDDVSIVEAPTCPAPNLVTMNNVLTTSADVSWDCIGCTGNFTVEYGAAGFAVGAGTQINTGTSSASITGLQSGTAYDAYVWQDCGGGDLSDTSIVVTFTTTPACGDNWYDNGGAAGNYASNSNDSITFCPDAAGEFVSITFNTFDTETSWDAVYVFDGPTTSSPMIASANPAPNGNDVYGSGGYWGAIAPGPFASTHPSGCLTFAFTSDGSVTNPGWDATVNCLPQFVTLDINVFLEGSYNADSLTMDDDLRGLGMVPLNEPYTGLGFTQLGSGGETITAGMLGDQGANSVVDWMLVELRDPADPAVIVATAIALVQRDGGLVALDGISSLQVGAPWGDHYLAVRHRNHLGVMSAAPISLGATATTVDFTNGSVATWGTDAQTSVGGVNMLWMGNVMVDGELKYTGPGNDRDPILSEIGGSVPTNTTTGYSNTDVDMDGTTKYTGTNNDRDPILINVGGSVPTAVRMEQLP